MTISGDPELPGFVLDLEPVWRPRKVEVEGEFPMRKIRLTPLQREVLWSLEEAGEETLATVVAELRLPNMDTLERDVQTLICMGFLRRVESLAGTTLVLTTDGRQALTK